MRSIGVLAITCFCAMGAIAADVDTIRVDGGLITGTAEDGVSAFKGIPYAAPPVGDLRWRPPQRVEDWDGVRACTEFGPDCPYPPYPKGSLYWREPRPNSEDCLYLNVWSIAEPGDQHPVMLWIHGGGFSRGSGATDAYNGAALAKKGVVLVTINYRLNVFGFLAHPELTDESEHNSSGNYGLLDMIAALEWVQRNIEQFGGDPDRVTIFGESAGSWGVNCLVASPLAKGLFHRAIGQSGASFGAMTPLSGGEGESAEEMGVAFGAAAGADSLDEMRALSAEQLLSTFTSDPEGRKFSSRAIVDGWVLPSEIRDIFAAGKHNDVPVILGSNRDEAAAFMAPSMLPTTLEAYDKRMRERYGDDFDAFAKVFPVTSEDNIRDAVIHSGSDRMFGLSMRTWARMTANGDSPAYLYYFTRVPPIENKEFYGAFHAAEIQYAFDNVGSMGRDANYTEVDQKLADVISQYWVNFAKTGDPNGDGLPKWEPYNEKDEPYMELGDTPKLGHHLRKAELDFQESIAQ